MSETAARERQFEIRMIGEFRSDVRRRMLPQQEKARSLTAPRAVVMIELRGGAVW